MILAAVIYSPEGCARGSEAVQREVVQQLLHFVGEQILEAIPAK